MKLKTHKTVSDRIKVTSSGKAVQRHTGQDHFNARENGNDGRKKRREREVSTSYRGAVKKLMPNHSITL